TTPSTNVGLCYVKFFPGDEKIYIYDHLFASSSPTSDLGLDYNKAIFFYEEQLSSDASDAATLARVTNASARLEIDLKTDELAFPDDRLNGFENDKKYCLVHANQNQAGNIMRFTDSAQFSSLASSLCITPNEVIGLLKDKKCFIATAAFGSAWAPPVQILRDFRDDFLLQTSWGKGFVKFYYHNSPPLADWIGQRTWAKVIVRVVLWPVVGIAYLFNHWLSALAWIIFSVLFLFSADFLYRRSQRWGS
ncbi:MAG: CFI-box-CTERM domain-containing protein, partial [Pseudobdellovibrionaceae bacterium]